MPSGNNVYIACCRLCCMRMQDGIRRFRLEIIGAVLLAALYCGDLITTHFILLGGGVELNPFARPLWEAGILSVLLHQVPAYLLLVLVLAGVSITIRWISKGDVRFILAGYYVWVIVLSMFAIPLLNNLGVLIW